MDVDQFPEHNLRSSAMSYDVGTPIERQLGVLFRQSVLQMLQADPERACSARVPTADNIREQHYRRQSDRQTTRTSQNLEALILTPG
jgi:hypothetical protein